MLFEIHKSWTQAKEERESFREKFSLQNTVTAGFSDREALAADPREIKLVFNHNYIRFSESTTGESLPPQDYDTIWPSQQDLQFGVHLIGISTHPEGFGDSFQFIFSNQTRSSSNDAGLKDKKRWEDKFIPTGTEVRKISVLYERGTSKLMGIELKDNDDNDLLKASREIKNYKAQKNLNMKTVKLAKGERVIGVMSCQRGENKAQHYDLQFILSKDAQTSDPRTDIEMNTNTGLSAKWSESANSAMCTM